MSGQKSEKLKIAEARLAEATAHVEIIKNANEHKLRTKQQELGRIGEWFGSRENAALYIVGATIVLGMIILGLTAWGEPTLRADFAKVIGGLVIAGFGYIGGLLSK